MLPPLLIGVGWVFAGISLYFWSRRIAASGRTVDAPDVQPTAAYSGGFFGRAVTTSSGLAVLELLDWGVRLRGSRLWRWAVPTWEARYLELSAQPVSGPLSRDGVRLRVDSMPDAVVFWTGQGAEILARLAEHGVAVNHARARVRRVPDLYQP